MLCSKSLSCPIPRGCSRWWFSFPPRFSSPDVMLLLFSRGLQTSVLKLGRVVLLKTTMALRMAGRAVPDPHGSWAHSSDRCFPPPHPHLSGWGVMLNLISGTFTAPDPSRTLTLPGPPPPPSPPLCSHRRSLFVRKGVGMGGRDGLSA